MANLTFIEEMSGLGFKPIQKQDNIDAATVDAAMPKIAQPDSIETPTIETPTIETPTIDTSTTSTAVEETTEDATQFKPATFDDLDRQLGITPTEPTEEKEFSIFDIIPSFVSTAQAEETTKPLTLKEELQQASDKQFGKNYVEDLEREETVKKVEEFAADSFLNAKNYIKGAIYGTGKSIFDLGRLAAYAPEYIWRGKSLLERASAEATFGIIRYITPDSWEDHMEKTVVDWGGNANFLQYRDVFDTQTQIDASMDEILVPILNGSKTVMTALGGNYSDVDSYEKFVERFFSVYDVPEEERNVLTQTIIYTGEFIIPIGTFGATGKLASKVATPSIEELSKKLAGEIAKKPQQLTKDIGRRVDPKTGEKISLDVSTTFKDLSASEFKVAKDLTNEYNWIFKTGKRNAEGVIENTGRIKTVLNAIKDVAKGLTSKDSLRKLVDKNVYSPEYEKLLRLQLSKAYKAKKLGETTKYHIVPPTLKPTILSARHTTLGNFAADMNKSFTTGLGGGNLYLGTNIQKALRTDLDIALGAAAGMAVTEELLEYFGLDELKPLSIIVGLGAGLAGARRTVSGIGGAIGTLVNQPFKWSNLILHHVAGRQGDIETSQTAYLRFLGYKHDQINKMSMQEKVNRMTLDPKLYKVSKQLGVSLAKLAETHPEFYKELQESAQYAQDLIKNFNNHFAQDVKKGYINQDHADLASAGLPILLNQIAMLSGITNVRNKLLSSGINTGIIKSNIAVISELDEVAKIVATQGKMLEKSLNSITNQLEIAGKIDNRSEVAKIIDILNDHKQNLNLDRKGAADRINDAKAKSFFEVDPVNNPTFKKSVEDAFGNDEFDEFSNIIDEIKNNPRRIDKETGQPLSLEREAALISAERLKIFGAESENLIKESFNTIKTAVDKKYEDAKLKDILIPVNTLITKYTNLVDDTTDVTRAFDPTEKQLQRRFETTLQSARRNGLNLMRKQFNDDEEYLTELTLLDIKFENAVRQKEGKSAFSAEEKEKFVKKISKQTDPIDYLQKRLIKKPSFISVKDIDAEPIIPVALTLSELNTVRSKIIFKAATTQGSDRQLFREQADAFDTQTQVILKNLENTMEEGTDLFEMQKLQKGAMQAFKDANMFYAKTMGKTFKKRLGAFLDKEVIKIDSSNQKVSIPSEDILLYFIRYNNPREAAKQFKRMFSNIDDKGDVIEGTLNDNAKQLMIKTIRRFLTSGESGQGGVNGLNKLSTTFLKEFAEELGIVKDKQALNNFNKWRTLEQQYPERKKLYDKHTTELNDIIKTLDNNAAITIDESIFGGNLKAVSTKDLVGKFFSERLFEVNAGYYAAREPLEYFAKKVENGEITQDAFDAYKRNKEFVDEMGELYLKDPSTLEKIDVNDITSKLDVPIKAGASKSDSPVKIFLDSIKEVNKKEEARELLKILFVKHLEGNAFGFTDKKTFESYRSFEDAAKNIEEAQEKGNKFYQSNKYTLVRDVNLTTFAETLLSNEKTLEILWENDPKQLAKIKTIFETATVLRGAIEAGGQEVATSNFKLNSLISRIYSIQRGVVSPRYVASEAMLQQAQLNKSRFMLRVLTDPATTDVILETMVAVATGKQALNAEIASKFKRVALAISLADVNEDLFIKPENYPEAVKGDAWVLEQLLALSAFITEPIKDISYEKESGEGAAESIYTSEDRSVSGSGTTIDDDSYPTEIY